VVGDYMASEWAYIPHFYNAFYVFQYCTSFTASLALSERFCLATQGRERVFAIYIVRRLTISDRTAEGLPS
jgi:oligoendopeptidase F